MSLLLIGPQGRLAQLPEGRRICTVPVPVTDAPDLPHQSGSRLLASHHGDLVIGPAEQQASIKARPHIP
jgi:hypothetical protein